MQSRRTILRAGAGLALTATAVGVGTLPVFADATGSGTGWAGLAARIQGDIVLPVDSGYNAAKELQIAAFDAVHPQAIAYPETPQDVQALVNYARTNGISVRVRSGGHNFNGWSTGEGLVIDTSRLNHATVGTSTVKIGPGLQSIDALHALAPYNKQVIAGTCPTVAPGGFISGGGIGFQTRKFGLGSDRLRSAQIVLADGRLIRASETSYSDLFWALRGSGGGNFGVVTEFEVAPIDAPRMVFFSTMWAWDKAEQVFAAWQTWQLNASVNLGSALIYNLPDAAPGNVPMVIITGGYHGPESEAQAALAQLTSLVGAQPTSTFASDLPYADAMKTAYGCGDLTQEQCHREGTGAEAHLHRTAFQRDAYRMFNQPFTPSQISTVLSTLDSNRVAGQRRVVHCMAVGGNANNVSPTATAYVHRQANFVIGYVGQLDAPTPESEAAASAFVQTGADVLNPISNGAYVNFPGSSLPDWATQYYGDNYLRLKKVKKAYDPNNFFRHPRSIGSLGQ
ncbi:FAD-binding oxidoreductase [Streptomyces sp. NBC_00503]|uniref:FAD-binding oxidoreductase n=1 Tax=Streptomyces sp. NBC_00503 TaxID=2903659 RepID=UPI002E813143|nr:FAD-binding oxidoreductase [Streptomyces sp. NBC_00503]WUD82717.1 FAD-binding oxidoreductase [Streptomyces sp. NBC_00503]